MGKRPKTHGNWRGGDGVLKRLHIKLSKCVCKSVISVPVQYILVMGSSLSEMTVRSSGSVDQNATRTSKRRRIPVRQNGLSLTAKQLGRSSAWTPHLNLRSTETFQLNTTENYGRSLLRQ